MSKNPSAPVKKRKRRSTYKSVQQKTTVASAIGDACSELQSLRDECSEWKDNLEEKLSHTEKYSALEEVVDSLDAADSEPDVPGFLQDHEVIYHEMVPTRKNRGTSRAQRLDNACSMLRAAADVAQEVVDGDDYEEDLKNEAEQLVSDVEELIGTVEGVEFPGMYG